jgi:hypothetical protein
VEISAAARGNSLAQNTIAFNASMGITETSMMLMIPTTGRQASGSDTQRLSSLPSRLVTLSTRRLHLAFTLSCIIEAY